MFTKPGTQRKWSISRRPPIWACSHGCKRFNKINFDGKDGIITIETIAIYDKHKIVETIDIVIDDNGNFVPYTNGGKNSSHSHKWEQDDSLNMGRKSHDKSNSLPIDPKYQSLIDAVIAYNKAGKKWKK